MDGWNAGQWEGREEVHGSESTPEPLGLRRRYSKEKTANSEKDGAGRLLLASMLQVKTQRTYGRGFKHFCFVSRETRLSSELRSYLTVNLDKLPNLPYDSISSFAEWEHEVQLSPRTTVRSNEGDHSRGVLYPMVSIQEMLAATVFVGWCGCINIVWVLLSWSMLLHVLYFPPKTSFSFVSSPSLTPSLLQDLSQMLPPPGSFRSELADSLQCPHGTLFCTYSTWHIMHLPLCPLCQWTMSNCKTGTGSYHLSLQSLI